MKSLYRLYRTGLFVFAATLVTACQGVPDSNLTSTGEDALFAQQLWDVMEGKRLVGRQAKQLDPFFGGAKPHGMILEILSQPMKKGQHSGFLVLKRNYNGDDVSVENVRKNRRKYLSSITVMYQREAGYDEDNLNMFWAKYKPDGDLFIKEFAGREMQLAGRLIKGESQESNKACLYCHASAGGGDYIFYPDIKLPGFDYPDE